MVKAAVITGATSGIGLATVLEMAKRGYSVVGIGRDPGRCEAAKQAVLAACPEAEVEYLLCDLTSQTQIRATTQTISSRYDAVDALINVAGTVSSHFMTTEDGIELQLAVNHLSAFLLARLLLPRLMKASSSRVVTISSGSHYGARLDFEDLQLRRRYSLLRQYKRVKLMNVLFTAEFNRRLDGASNVRAFAADPGLVRTEIGLKGTCGLERAVWRIRMRGGCDPSVPAKTIAYLASDPALSLNREIYWRDQKPKRPSPYALREDEAKRLWEISERLCRLQPQL